MIVVYVGESAAERDAVRDRLRGSRAPLRLSWALGLHDLVGVPLVDGATLVIGTDIPPHERLRLLSFLAQTPDVRVIALGSGRGPFGASVPLEQLSPRALVERATRPRGLALTLRPELPVALTDAHPVAEADSSSVERPKTTADPEV